MPSTLRYYQVTHRKEKRIDRATLLKAAVVVGGFLLAPLVGMGAYGIQMLFEKPEPQSSGKAISLTEMERILGGAAEEATPSASAPRRES